MNTKIFNFIGMGTILLALGFLLLMGFWLIYPYRTSEYKNLPQKVDKRVVKGGEHITIFVDLCKYSDIMPIVSRSFVDGIIYNIPSYVGVNDQMGCHIFNVQVYIPKALPNGKYYIRTNYKWQVNPIRTIEKQVTTEMFEVID